MDITVQCVIDNYGLNRGVHRGWWYNVDAIKRIEETYEIVKNTGEKFKGNDTVYKVKIANAESKELINAWLDARDFYIAGTNTSLVNYIEENNI